MPSVTADANIHKIGGMCPSEKVRFSKSGELPDHLPKQTTNHTANMEIKRENLQFGKILLSNVDYQLRECHYGEHHTLEEWMEFAMEQYGKCRVQVYLGKTHRVFEACQNTVEYCGGDKWLYEQCEIREFSDSWGQVCIYLAFVGKDLEETKKCIWKEMGLLH